VYSRNRIRDTVLGTAHAGAAWACIFTLPFSLLVILIKCPMKLMAD
jgi:hypothetical protein